MNTPADSYRDGHATKLRSDMWMNEIIFYSFFDADGFKRKKEHYRQRGEDYNLTLKFLQFSIGSSL